MRYGMNPHQSASIVAGHGPRVINGEPSMINYLDAGGPEATHAADSYFDVPGKSGFQITVASGICEYICSFLA